MKTFREHLNEEVKIGALASGGIDIDRDAVRDEVNGILAGIAARPCVTPYASLNKVRKALSYFSIFLPKRVYLEGRHGIEVWEVKQFGDKMGVTDQGEWIHHVPAKYYVFFHYHMMGSMYYLEAKIVDEKELETKINTAERMVSEGTDSACRQDMVKASAPKEPMHDVTSDEKKKGNKAAVADSEKGLDEGWVAISRNGPIYDKFGDVNPNAKFYGRKRPVNKPGDAEPGAGDTYKGSKQGGKVKTAKTVKEEKGNRLIPQTMNNPIGPDKTGAGERDRGITFVPKNTKGNDDDMPQITLKPEGKFSNRAYPDREAKFESVIFEKAPPGAKFERMVKHIKKGYAKDGLSKKEKGIAFATAWKAKKRETED